MVFKTSSADSLVETNNTWFKNEGWSVTPHAAVSYIEDFFKIAPTSFSMH
jgi:hypothetical protein